MLCLQALLAGCYAGAPELDAHDPNDPSSPRPTAPGPLMGRAIDPPLELDALAPDPAPGGVEFALRVTGANFEPGDTVLVEGVPLLTSYVSPGELVAQSGPLPRGRHGVVVVRGEKVSAPLWLPVGNAAPQLELPGEVVVAEDEPLTLDLMVRDVDDTERLRVFLRGLPPGASWDEAARRLSFTPDFIQGGVTHTIEVTADDGRSRAEGSFTLVVLDTITPPDPEIVDTEFLEDKGYARYTLSQVSDAYLDSPGYAGRSFKANVMVPLEPPAEGVPVRIGLHGFATANPGSTGSASEIRISPHDPDNTYWWGYATSLPEMEAAVGGAVPDYTARRVLHLLEWTMREFPEADPRRVHIYGSSMGGAGAMTMGLLHGRHFAYVDARLGQAVPRNHRPGRVTQLSEWWGAPDETPGEGSSVWDLMDLTRVLAASAEARDQFLFLKHGKDDATIHFGAAVLPSPVTDESLYAALQRLGVGHFAVWDEGGHGTLDPVLGDGWWSKSWAPMSGAHETSLRTDLAFPAFSLSSLDGDPGVGAGNGKRPWSVNAGFAGDDAVAGDTGWEGDIAGAINRFLRWDAASVVDTVDRLQFALKVLDGEGSAAPKSGYPTRGDRLGGDLPALVDVTARRVQAFRCRPGERVLWSFGQARGEVLAGPDGSVTVPSLPLTAEWQTLVLRRPRPHERQAPQ